MKPMLKWIPACVISLMNMVISCLSVNPEGTDRTSDIGKFLGEFEGPLMIDLVAKKIFSEIKMVDFQGVCLQRALRADKNSGSIFRGMIQTFTVMLWNFIHHLAMILVRDIMLWPSWSYAAKKAIIVNQNTTGVTPKPVTHVRESLSNILLTHIDFRRPTLDYKRSNSTRDDETIEKVPESCIEEFILYVSTWKGWQGPLPSKDNSINWEQVERENTVRSVVHCTHVNKPTDELHDEIFDNGTNETNASTTIPPPPIPTAESFGYSISKIPKSNLMMIYVNHSEQTSSCAKLIIKRKPVEFTPDEWCMRLKTTPYRERPHKCFFVHDGENKTLFPKCSHGMQTIRIEIVNFILFVSITIMIRFLNSKI